MKDEDSDQDGVYYSNKQSESSNSNLNYVPPSLQKATGSFNSNASDKGIFMPSSNPAMMSGGAMSGNNFYKMLFEQNDEEILVFVRKMYSFFSIQKIVMGIFITYVYNNVPFTLYIADAFLIFASSAFIFLMVLLSVHVALDYVRHSPYSYICYLLFTLSESWVIAFLLARTDPSTVFLFAVSLTGMVLAISLFLHTVNLTYWRGMVSIFAMLVFMFVVFMLTLKFADFITICVCMSAAFLFGIFLLTKAFALLQNKYSHQLRKDDYVIASITIYVDFGFVLLIMMFIMLAQIKSFTSQQNNTMLI